MHAFGYIRVSKARDDMVSPEVQRDEISAFAERKGWQIVRWFEDIDVSGRTDQRPGLQEMVQAAISGEAQAILLYRLDRLSRRPAHHFALLALLREAGVLIDSVHQPYQEGPEGELMWGLNAVLNEYESLRLSVRLRDMHRRLAALGRWNGGIVPYGWRRTEDEHGSRLVLDPDEAHWRRWMHERYQRGWSCLRIARYLNEHGVATRSGGGLWSDGTVWQTLRSSYQVGARQTQDGLADGGNVEPLLGRDTYERTLALMQARRTQRGRTGTHPLPSRLVRCGTCGGPMASTQSAGHAVYACRRRRQGACGRGVSIRYSSLEDYVEERLFRHLAKARAPKARRPVPQTAPLREELERVRESLGRLAALYAEGTISADEFQSARSLQRKRQERARQRLERYEAGLEADAKEAALEAAWEDLGRLTREAWHTLSPQARRDIYDLVIAEIVVDPVAGHAPEHRRPERRVRIRWR